MSLPQRIADRITLPVVCAPMFLISGPELVIAARAANHVEPARPRDAGDGKADTQHEREDDELASHGEPPLRACVGAVSAARVSRP